ncbi:unnamed protein product [Prorocentrum cordatum]|nr:unnamed protein product [Polarella glacialis]
MSEDPVVARDGFTYHRACITRWFARGKCTSPRTNETLESTILTPNIDMRNLIQAMPQWMPEGQHSVHYDRGSTVTGAEDLGGSQGAAQTGPEQETYSQQAQSSLWAVCSYAVKVVEGPEDLRGYTFTLAEVDSDATAAVVQSLVAEHLETYVSRAMHVSRLRLQCGNADVNVLSVIPSRSEIQVTIVEHDWQDIVNSLPDTKKQFFSNLAQEPHPEDPALLYCDTAEFSEMLRLQATLLAGCPTRGAQSADEWKEWAEFVSVLQEARSQVGATPSSMLRVLQEQFC